MERLRPELLLAKKQREAAELAGLDASIEAEAEAVDSTENTDQV